MLNDKNDGFFTVNNTLLAGGTWFSVTSVLTGFVIGSASALGIASGIGVIGIVATAGIFKIVDYRKQLNNDLTEEKGEDEMKEGVQILKVESQEFVETDSTLLRLKKSQELMEKLERLQEEAILLNNQTKMMKYEWGLTDQLPSVEHYIPLSQRASKEEIEKALRSMEEIESKMTCPITQEPILGNHVMADDGQCYDKDALQQHYDIRKNDFNGARCPLNSDIELTNPEKLKPSHLINYLKRYCDILYGSYDRFLDRMESLRNRLSEFNEKNKESTKKESLNYNSTIPKIYGHGFWSSKLKCLSEEKKERFFSKTNRI